MSSKIVVDPNQLAAQAEYLRQRLLSLDLLAQQITTAIQSVKIALDTLLAPEKSEEVVVPGDPGFNVLFKARLADKDKVIYHVGGGIYAVINRDEAHERLIARLGELNKILDEIQKERLDVEEELARVEYLLQLVLARASAAKEGERGQ